MEPETPLPLARFDQTEDTRTLACFDDRSAALRCLVALRRRQLFNPGMHIELQNEDGGHGELPIEFTHSWVGFLKGGALGGAAGLVFGVAFTFLQFEELVPLYLAPFLLFGTILGAFGGALSGAMNPSVSIEETENKGGVSLRVESSDTDDVAWAARAFVRFGGVIVGKVPAPTPSNGPLGGPRRPLGSRA